MGSTPVRPGEGLVSNLICFGAHADDIEFGCMGTVIKLLEEGYSGRFVILTNGENGFKAGAASREERIRIRKEEQLEVGRKLGLKEVIFLDYPDGLLTYSDDLRRRLVEILKRLRPDKVFSFDPANQEYDDINLFHRDHRIAARVVFDACFAAKNLWMYPGEAHRVGEIHFFGSHKPNHFVDITDVMERKLELLACHRSQFPDFAKVEKLVKEKMSKPHGGFEYAEGYRVLQVEQVV
jgi:LmbE family N-acetylglucosaminyl deacetylase